MKTALAYGALIAIANAVLTLVLFFIGYHSDPAKMLSLGQIPSLIVFVISIVGIVLGIRARRNETPASEPFTYGKAFSTGLLTGIFAALFGSAFYLLYILVINPTFSDTMLQAQLIGLQAKNFNSQQIEAAKKVMTFMLNPAIQVSIALVSSIIQGLVVALVAAAVLKRNTSVPIIAPPPLAS